jgi:hypothetical protein
MMPVLARVLEPTRETSPPSPSSRRNQAPARKPGTAGEGGELGEGLQLRTHARASRARTLPILPVAVDSSGLCVPCGKARGQNDEYLIDDNGYRRRDPMAAGDTQITIARIPDLRSRALSAWLRRNAGGASYRPNYEARRQSRRKIWETHHHPGSAEGRAQRAKLPGCPMPV